MKSQIATNPVASDSRFATLHVPLARPIPKWVRWTFLLFLASLPLEALPIENVTSEYVTLPKMFGFVFFACYLFYSGIPFKIDFPAIPTALWWFLAYLGVYAFTGTSLENEGIKGYVIRLLKLIQLFVLFWVASGLFRDPRLAKKSLLTLAIVCVGLAVGTLIGLPGFTPEAGTNRVTAFDFNPNTVASLMTYAAIIIIGFCLKESGWSAKRKLGLLALTIPLLMTMVSTGSRSGIMSIIFGLSFAFIPHRGSRRQMLAFGVVLAAIIGIGVLVVMDPIASERWLRTIEEGESSNRGAIFGAAWAMFEEKPIVGWGGRMAFEELAARVGRTTGQIDAHNAVLYLLIEVGIIGTIPFLVGLWLCAREAWKGRVDQFGLVPFELVMAMFAYNLTHTALTQKVFWLFLGFAVAASSINGELRYRWIVSKSGKKASGLYREEFRRAGTISSNS